MKKTTATIITSIIGAFAILGAALIGLYYNKNNKESPQAGRDLIIITQPQSTPPPEQTQIIDENIKDQPVEIGKSKAAEEKNIKGNCTILESPQKVQMCFNEIISKGNRFEIDSEIKKALNTKSNTILSIALKAYLATRPELKLTYTAPEPEMEILKEYIENPTRENKREMLSNHRYLLFLNDTNFQHVFSISKFDMASGKGQLREISKGRDTPHNFQVIGTEFGFNTPWCLDRKLNCKCRYDLYLRGYKLEGDAVCTGYFDFKPLKVEHRLHLN